MSSTDLEAFLARVLLVIVMIANPQVNVVYSSGAVVAAYLLCSKGVAKVHMTQAKHSGDWGRRKQQDNTPKHRRHKKVTLRGGLICTLCMARIMYKSELQLKVNCRPKVNCGIKFGLARPTVGKPAQIFPTIHFQSKIHFQLQFICTWSSPWWCTCRVIDIFRVVKQVAKSFENGVWKLRWLGQNLLLFFSYLVFYSNSLLKTEFTKPIFFISLLLLYTAMYIQYVLQYYIATV